MKATRSSIIQLWRPVFVAIFICFGGLDRANANTMTETYQLTYTGPGSPTSFSTVLDIAGTPLTNNNNISMNIIINGSGPTWVGQGPFGSPPSPGWYASAIGTVTDNWGDSFGTGVDDNDCFCLNHPIDGGGFSFAIVPTSLQIDMGLNPSYFGGPINITATMSVFLPPGLYVAPLPTTIPLFAAGLVMLGLLGSRRKRKAQAVAA